MPDDDAASAAAALAKALATANDAATAAAKSGAARNERPTVSDAVTLIRRLGMVLVDHGADPPYKVKWDDTGEVSRVELASRSGVIVRDDHDGNPYKVKWDDTGDVSDFMAEDRLKLDRFKLGQLSSAIDAAALAGVDTAAQKARLTELQELERTGPLTFAVAAADEVLACWDKPQCKKGGSFVQRVLTPILGDQASADAASDSVEDHFLYFSAAFGAPASAFGAPPASPASSLAATGIPRVLTVAGGGLAAANGVYDHSEEREGDRPVWIKRGDDNYRIQWSPDDVWMIDYVPGRAPYCVPDRSDDSVPLDAAWVAYQDYDGTLPAPTVTAGAEKYTCLRFRTTRTRDPNSDELQIASFEAYDAHGQKLELVDAVNPGGENPDGEEPQKALDGNPSTKWLDFRKGALECRMANGPSIVTKYALTTANDFEGRDPVRWVVEGRMGEQEEWRVLDDKSGEDQQMPYTRHTRYEVAVAGHELGWWITPEKVGCDRVCAHAPLDVDAPDLCHGHWKEPMVVTEAKDGGMLVAGPSAFNAAEEESPFR